MSQSKVPIFLSLSLSYFRSYLCYWGPLDPQVGFSVWEMKVPVSKNKGDPGGPGEKVRPWCWVKDRELRKEMLGGNVLVYWVVPREVWQSFWDFWANGAHQRGPLSPSNLVCSGTGWDQRWERSSGPNVVMDFWAQQWGSLCSRQSAIWEAPSHIHLHSGQSECLNWIQSVLKIKPHSPLQRGKEVTPARFLYTIYTKVRIVSTIV